MQTSINTLATSILVVLAMVTLALLLLGLPELRFVADPYNEWQGSYSANIVDLLSRTGNPDEFACGAANLMPGCSYVGITVHALVFELTPESQGMLVRHLKLMMGGWFLLVGIGFRNFVRAWDARKSILTLPTSVPVPIAFAQWVLAVLAMAYLLSLANWS